MVEITLFTQIHNAKKWLLLITASWSEESGNCAWTVLSPHIVSIALRNCWQFFQPLQVSFLWLSFTLYFHKQSTGIKWKLIGRDTDLWTAKAQLHNARIFQQLLNVPHLVQMKEDKKVRGKSEQLNIQGRGSAFLCCCCCSIAAMTHCSVLVLQGPQLRMRCDIPRPCAKPMHSKTKTQKTT